MLLDRPQGRWHPRTFLGMPRTCPELVYHRVQANLLAVRKHTNSSSQRMVPPRMHQTNRAGRFLQTHTGLAPPLLHSDLYLEPVPKAAVFEGRLYYMCNNLRRQVSLG